MKTNAEVSEYLEAGLAIFLGRKQGDGLNDQMRSEIRMCTGALIEKLIVHDEVPFDEYIVICGIKNNPPEEITSNRCNVYVVTPQGQFNINIGKITKEVIG